jgi:hypothetical protein
MLNIKEIGPNSTRKLIIKTPFKNDREFLDYARRNLLTLLRGWVPNRKDIWRPVAGGKGSYELSNNYACLEYYRYASAIGRVKKIPFFIYWLLLEKSRLLNRGGIDKLINKQFRLESDRVTEIEQIVSRLSDDARLNAGIRARLKTAYNSFAQQKYRIFLRYERKETAKGALLRMARGNLLIEPIRIEILDFIDQRDVTTWSDLRRYKRSLKRIRPDLLMAMLESLENEGRISIYNFSTGMYLKLNRGRKIVKKN